MLLSSSQEFSLSCEKADQHGGKTRVLRDSSFCSFPSARMWFNTSIHRYTIFIAARVGAVEQIAHLGGFEYATTLVTHCLSRNPTVVMSRFQNIQKSFSAQSDFRNRPGKHHRSLVRHRSELLLLCSPLTFSPRGDSISVFLGKDPEQSRNPLQSISISTMFTPRSGHFILNPSFNVQSRLS